MFGGCFALNDKYRVIRSSSLESSLESSFIGSVAGLAVLLLAGGFGLRATVFTLIISCLSAINGILFMLCSFKALDTASLSVYSLFSMLGGMMLPFIQGIAFYGEKITPAKIICVLFVCVSLLLTLSPEKGKSGVKYYFAVFVLNGMSGVLSKIFTSANFPKTDAEQYSIWGAAFTALLSGALWIILRKKQRSTAEPYNAKALTVASVNGALNRVANLLLVIALTELDASVQYPFVTGGVIAVSTVIAFFGEKKPSIRELLSCLAAVIGMIILFLFE